MTDAHWVERHLRDLITIKHGFAFQGEYFKDRGPYFLLTPGNFWDEGGFKLASKQKFYDGPVPAGYVLAKGDLIVAMTEQAEGLLGSAALIPAGGPFLHNQRLGLVETDRLNKRFLYYLLNSHPVRQQIRATASGAKVRHTSPTRIGDVKVRVPPLATQRRIADILSAYDDLIEVNQRRIATLEEMARRLFEEWFVRFRYPGHEDDVLAEGPLGQAPSTWAIVPASALIEFDPRTQVPRDGEKPFVPMSALSTNSMVIEGVETRSGNSGSKFIQGDTLFARITPCAENGKTGFVDFLDEGQPAFGSTEFIVMRGREAGPRFIYCLARSRRFRDVAIRSMAGADGRQRVRNEAVSGFLIPRPPAALMKEFERHSAPMFAQVRVLAHQNSRLRAARDLLLPKLISGEIDVSAAPAPDDVARDAA